MMQEPADLTVIRREIVVRAPIRRAWQALTDPAEMNCWYTRSAVVDWRVGGALALGFGWDVSEQMTVIEWAPPERLAHQADHGVTTAWSLICADNSVRVVVEISGIVYDDRSSAYLESSGVGYGLLLGNLKCYIEEGRDERASWWRTWLGILHVTTGEDETVRGSRIARVIPDSSAEASGLRLGDVVVGIDGQRVNSLTDLAQSLVYRTPGERVTLRIVRDQAGSEREVPLVLEKRPDDLH